MRDRMVRYLLSGICFLMYLIVTSVCYAVVGEDERTILVLNSYHKGYEWSDQIVSGIESTLLLTFPKADIHVEYMDTKRNSTPWYIDKISTFFQEKFKNQQFDLIIGADDHAINFLQKFGATVFPGVPVVFCGANALDAGTFLDNSNFTGVLEFADIKGTLDIAFHLQPNVRKIVVINDDTTTGRYIAREFDNVVPKLNRDLEIEILDDLPITELADFIRKLQPDTIVLLLAYLRDGRGTFYEPQYTASVLSAASSVPIYSIWDFYFNFGITGGVLTSGFRQGEVAAELAIEILKGSAVSDIEIITSGANRLLFDYRQMERFGLPVEKLPQDVAVKNITYTDQKNILILHSYSSDNPWTRAIMEGLDQQLSDSGFLINSFTEFMDTKRFTDKPYMHAITQLLALKYSYQDLDLVIVSDDNAFNFIQRQRDQLFTTVPVVFCGVNYLPEPEKVPSGEITGVMESYDIPGTLQLGLSLYPETEVIYVINDATTTGVANRQRFDQIVAELPQAIRIEHSGSVSMQQLQQKVAGLNEKTLVLLMSFTMDKNNHQFSYQQSARLITSSSARPVLGFWDFYLGNGILGGVITRGWDQGKTAGFLARSVLAGEKASTIPIVEKSPVTSVVDYDVVHRFNLDLESIPTDIQVINRPESFVDQYRVVVYVAVGAFGILLIIVAIQTIKIILQTKDKKLLAVKATTDPLTGVNNRDYFDDRIDGIIASAVAADERFALCYLDLDNLKSINDTFGHKSGDEYILLAVDSIRSQMRRADLLCRVGGDEFIAILNNCTASQGRALAGRAEEELLVQLEQRGHSWNAGISCGSSEFNPREPVSVATLIEEADQMMYRHKQDRRKRTHQ